MIENGDYHSLTFHIYRLDSDSHILENLVLMLQEDRSYVAAIYKYELTPIEREILLSGGQTTISGDVSRTILPDFDSGSVIKTITPIRYTEVIIVPCSEDKHGAGDMGQWHQCEAYIKPKILTITRTVLVDTFEQETPLPGTEISSGGKGGDKQYNPNVPPFDPYRDFALVEGNLTKPVIRGKTPEQKFFNDVLTGEQRDVMMYNIALSSRIVQFLKNNTLPPYPSPAFNANAVEIASQILQFCVETGDVEGAIDIIDAYNNIENTLIFIGPDTPIDDMALYLSIFDQSQPATLTLYVDQPVPFTNIITDGESVGHTFIGIKQGNKSRTFGFYPTNSSNPINTSDPSKMGNDSTRHFDVSISLQIPSNTLQEVINFSINHPTSYDLNVFNCTDFGIVVGNLCGLSLPQCNSWWAVGYGSNPAKLGQYISENFSTNNQYTVNKIGGNPNPNSN